MVLESNCETMMDVGRRELCFCTPVHVIAEHFVKPNSNVFYKEEIERCLR